MVVASSNECGCGYCPCEVMGFSIVVTTSNVCDNIETQCGMSNSPYNNCIFILTSI